MHTHLLTPLAPLVLRTGKPFGDTGGGDSFAFPLPSTLAGALRTARADALEWDFGGKKDEILGWESRGPLLARSIADGGVAPLFPRPADSRYTRPDEDLILHRLSPQELNSGDGCDLPRGMLPVFLQSDDKSKPAEGPAWWTEQAMHTWLRGDIPATEHLGVEPLPVDTRSHVALEPATLAARTGQLFQSSGPDFEALRGDAEGPMEQRGWEPGRFNLLAGFGQSLAPTLLRLGGEARLAGIAPNGGWPELSKTLQGELEQARHIRLVLATPALFSAGWKPGWLGEDGEGSPPGLPNLRLRLKAVVVERWQPVSGWDLAANRPKAVRRMVPAGSVYWFEIVKASANWAREIWLTPISDNPQDIRDGFGLALPGIWKR